MDKQFNKSIYMGGEWKQDNEMEGWILSYLSYLFELTFKIHLMVERTYPKTSKNRNH